MSRSQARPPNSLFFGLADQFDQLFGPRAEDSLSICGEAGRRRSYADFLTEGKPLVYRRATGRRGRRLAAVQHEIVVGLGPVGRAPDGARLVRRFGPENGVEKGIDRDVVLAQ